MGSLKEPGGIGGPENTGVSVAQPVSHFLVAPGKALVKTQNPLATLPSFITFSTLWFLTLSRGLSVGFRCEP